MNGWTASTFRVEEEETKFYETEKCQDPADGNLLKSHRGFYCYERIIIKWFLEKYTVIM
jgi:hypothetical protein